MRIGFSNIVRFWICAVLAAGLLLSRGAAAEEGKAPAPPPAASAAEPTSATAPAPAAEPTSATTPAPAPAVEPTSTTVAAPAAEPTSATAPAPMPATAPAPEPAPAPAPEPAATPAPEPAPVPAPAAAPKAEPEPPPEPPKPKYGPDNPRQVRISARILEWTHKSSLDWGFSVLYEPTEGNLSEIVRSADATLPKQSPLNEGLSIFLDNIDRNSGAGGFEVVIDTLEQYGSVEIVTEPNVVIQCINDLPKDANGNVNPAAAQALQSYVKTTSQVPFDQAQPVGGLMAEITNWKDTAIQLDVNNVKIHEPNYIQMNINSSVTALSGFVTVAIDNAGAPSRRPAVNTRSLVNTVLVRDRSFFISGVLKTTKKFESSQGVPILARIPILKYFMRNEHVSEDVQELLFMVRPEILVN